MLKSMTDYFAAEKQESLLFVAVGLFAIAVSVWLWVNGHRLKFMAVPLVSIAAIQIVVGASVYLRTDRQVAALETQAASAPAGFKTEETVRMTTVMENFGIYKIIEIVLLALGVALILIWQRHDLAAGIGAGLVIQSAFMLALDMFAEARGQDYLSFLDALPG